MIFVITCFSVQISLTITETFRHPFQVYKLFDRKWGPSVIFFSHKKRWGVRRVTSGEDFRKSCVFHEIFLFLLTQLSRAYITFFPLSSSMEQVSVYEKAAVTSQDNALQSDEDQTPLMDVSSMPDVAKDADAVPPSSIPAGLAGPVTCHLDLSFTAPSPVLAGPHALAWVDYVPLSPSEPSEDYLCRSRRLPPDSATSVPQPATVAPSTVLITLSPALPRPFPTFEGPGRSSRAPTPAQGSRKLLPDHSIGSLVVARTGLWLPSLQPASGGACPATSQRWSSCNDVPALCGLPAGPHPSQVMPGPTPYEPSAPARPGFWTPGASIPSVSCLLSCSFLCISPDDCAAPPQPSMNPAVPLRIMGPDELGQLSPSGGWASPWARHKSGSKRVDGSSWPRRPSGDRSLSNRDGWSCRWIPSLSSSSDRLSPPSKKQRGVSCSPGRCSCPHDDSWCSPGPRHHRASPLSTDSRHSHSPAPRRRPRTRPSLSHRQSLNGMTRTPTRDVSQSPRCRSLFPLARQSSRNHRTYPRTRRRSPNRQGRSSCSRSSTPHYTPAPPKVEWGYTGFTPMSVRPSVCPFVDKVSGTFWKKLLAQFISYLAFTLMEWVSWPLFIFVFLDSFLALWWPNIWQKGVSGTFWKNYWLNSFHTWHLPLWGESLDSYTFSCS